MVLFGMGLALFPERLGGGVEGPEDPRDIALRHAERGESPGDSGSVRALARPEATVTAAAISRADRAAAGLRDGTQARCPMRDHDANRAAQLAFVTDAVAWYHRLAADQKSLDDFQQLGFVDRAAAQLE